MRQTSEALVDALMRKRRGALRTATAMRQAERTSDAEAAEAVAHALEAWISVALGLRQRRELDAMYEVSIRLVGASEDIDAPSVRGHGAWLYGYDTGRRLVELSEIDS